MTIIGMVLGVCLILGAIAMQGTLAIFWNPSAILISIGGSFAALLINFGTEQIRLVFLVIRQVFLEKKDNPRQIISFFYNLSQKARREGLLALEDDVYELEDPFLRKGLQMVVDGMEPKTIRDVLTTEINALIERHKIGQELFKAWGRMSPAFGMIGTLIGLIQMLIQLDDPDAIGPGMAVALLTTFYGMMFANLILNPIAGKLEIRSEKEIAIKEAQMDGIIAIQTGMNPRILEDKLKAFIPPWERDKPDEEMDDEEGEGEGEDLL